MAAPLFVDITERIGLRFVHQPGARGEHWFPEIMGSGVALFDADNDGDLDIYLINGCPDAVISVRNRPHGAAPTAVDGRFVNRLYRCESAGGALRYTDVTESSGLGDAGYGMGMTIGDYDNDGDLDVYVTNVGRDRLFRNRGPEQVGVFEDVTAAAGIAVDGWSCSAAIFDYDRDGHLDIFVARYVQVSDRPACTDLAGRADYCNPDVFKAEPDVLLHNRGDGSFTDVSAAAGIADRAGPGLGVICTDVDEDGWPDVYVVNDGAPNHLWLNLRDGTFREEAMQRGAAVNWHGVPEAGMGVVCDDLDGDLAADFFLTHLRHESNTYYRKRPGGVYMDATASAGLGLCSTIYTGFGVAALDIELDGDLDLVIANGRVGQGDPPEGESKNDLWSRYAEPNQILVNEGGCYEAIDPHRTNETWGRLAEVSRGLAKGDLDQDGDVDLVVTNTGGQARVFRNDAPRRGAWLAVRAVDPALRRDAIGATVIATAGGRQWVRSMLPSQGYLSSSEPVAHFGLGDAERVDQLIVRWPDGVVERFGASSTNRAIQLRRGEGKVVR